MIDLDANATTPMVPEAIEAMRPWLGERYGNPSSAHALGRKARQAIEEAREQVATMLGASASEVIFTSGATEANNIALFGLCGDPPGRILVSALEHPCVLEPVQVLESRGFQIDWLAVDRRGIVNLNSVKELCQSKTRLACLMLANHETGALQPVPSAARLLPEGVFLHCDAAQAVGKMAVDFHALGVTTLAASAHKFGGPPGVGLLLIRQGTSLRAMMFGGPQQRGMRPGTEPVALIVGLAAALESALRMLDRHVQHLQGLRRLLWEYLLEKAAPVVLNGAEIDSTDALPNTLNVSFPGCRSDLLLMSLDLAGVACSTGSACSSGSLLPSPVLAAMGVSDDVLRSAIRFSFTPRLTTSEMLEAARRITECVSRLRSKTSGVVEKSFRVNP